MTPIAGGFALLLVVGLPALAAATGVRESQVEEISSARPAVYLSASLSMALLGVLAWGVARWQGIPADRVGWRVVETAPALGWALAATVAGLATVWGVTSAGRRLGLRESGLAVALMPRNAADRRGFILLAVVAAIVEEYIYRGYALHLLAAWWGDPWLAVGVTSVSFGVAHGYQRLVGVVRATVLGGLLAAPVVWTGSLFPAVAAHFWINGVVGLGGWRRLYPGAGDPGGSSSADEDADPPSPDAWG